MAKRGDERKARVEAEAHLVSSYIAFAYPDDYSMQRVRLGPIEPQLPIEELTESEFAMVGSFRRWADAIVIQANQLVLIEGAIRPSTGDPATILLYSRRIKSTPELLKWRDLPVRMELVIAIEDPEVSQIAYELGVNVIRYTTPETDAYIATIMPRFQRPTRWQPTA